MSSEEEKPSVLAATVGAATDKAIGETALAGLPLRRVLADNPGPLTGPGTTTWLVGRGAVTVIDPGPALPAHLEAIVAALDPDERIAAILVTHPHLDHSALVPDLARATGAPVYGFGPAGSGRSPAMQALEAAGLSGGEGIDRSFAPDIRLADGAEFQIGSETFRTLHTPGHSAEHLSFAWRGALFCGDHIMAWAPSLVSLPDGDMGAYMTSLQRLATESWTCLLPCHGEVIDDSAGRIAALIDHRLKREAKLLAALTSHPMSPDDLLPIVYADTPEALWPAARRNLLAHIADLTSREQVTATAWPGPSPLVTAR
ncbi:MBL fold metallo-hydrolase [Pseudomonas sp. GX19020]|uniref:MBL fold metallo-hydrolase n=1 Tax=Pseudomonas sp. GX19020 TaxID=2942277 RepID=UPI002019AAB1|nr:MBL fold metallo-hydrolase [Pseudomonas sp. GX19020]MCL4065106.1 MBL fold metallo-hydrolase [Pseudomonas sp. GX19020]